MLRELAGTAADGIAPSALHSFRRTATRDVELLGAPRRPRSSLIHGVKELRVRLVPRARRSAA